MNDRAAICELHFEPSDYLPAKEDSTTRKRLKKDAVPSVNPPRDSSRKIFHDDPVTSKTTLIGKATQPSHLLVKIEDGPSPIQICALCHKNTMFRCEANVCKIALCVSPCFRSHHEALSSKGKNFFIFD